MKPAEKWFALVIALLAIGLAIAKWIHPSSHVPIFDEGPLKLPTPQIHDTKMILK